MRVLALMPDTFGGRGGIALYNRDFLTARCAPPDCEEVVVIPRLSTGPSGKVPEKLTYLTESLGGKVLYAKMAVASARARRPFGLIVCGHINLLPVAMLVRALVSAPLVLLIYGIDAWQPTKSAIVNVLTKRVRHIVSISEVTRRRFLDWTRVPEERVAIIPNAIHLDAYAPGPKDPLLLGRYGLHDRTVLMTVGRRVGSHGMLGLMVDPADPGALVEAVLAALRKPRGVVPAGLDYFAYPEFERRVQALVAEVTGDGDAAAPAAVGLNRDRA